jgi:hypothetical protein
MPARAASEGGAEMTSDPLDQVLRLVAEGRLTADEAAPILAALDEGPVGSAPGTPAGAPGSGGTGGAPREQSGRAQRDGASGFGRGFASGFASGFAADPAQDGPRDAGASGGAGWADEAAGPGMSGGASSLRLEVRENGRQVVNLRLPIAVGRLALDRVPGLSGEQVDRVRAALGSGMRGPILTVDDGDSGVRIILE